MKKFISMVMAAAMVVSLVPATAFAASEATYKVVKDMEVTKDEAKDFEKNGITNAKGEWYMDTQLQIKIKDIDSKANVNDTFELKLKVDNAEFIKGLKTTEAWSADKNFSVIRPADQDRIVGYVELAEDVKVEDDTLELVVKENGYDFAEGDVVVVSLPSGVLKVTKTSVGATATVKVVDGDFGKSDELVFLTVLDKGIDAEIEDTVDIAVEEMATLEDITVEPAVGDDFKDVLDKEDKITLKLNSGFEFVGSTITVLVDDKEVVLTDGKNGVEIDDNKITIETDENGSFYKAKEVVFTKLQIEATTAKEGDVATVTVKFGDSDSVKLEAATVVEYKVVMSVDEDEDVPVFYNGVNSSNTGLTVDDDHESLVVTLEETFTGAWSNHKDFTLSLPEGVHVVDVTETASTLVNDKGSVEAEDLLAAAYKEGDHEYFEVEKRSFNETDDDSTEENSFEFALVLTADPDFVGDVVLTLEGDAVDTQEVTIAKFVPFYTIKAEQNDLKIDYRYTEVGTDIVITEAEAGLWDKKEMTIELGVDSNGLIMFEDDAVVTVNEESGMEVDADTNAKAGTIELTIEEESDEVPAVITISGIELFMQRNIPAGAYDLEVVKCSAVGEFEKETLFAADCGKDECDCDYEDADDYDFTCAKDDDHECRVADVCDYSKVVKEGWINVVTAGREADDASFTTKVVVPVGEAYIIAGETQVALDVPAYVNAAGYTMLPVRAVAVALGINTQNVLWDQATKTVTILYGQRIITMQVGAKVVYVNGSAIPASASVEIVDGRTFLPMRDLATALGVTDITWDAATKTATLNGNA